MAVLPVLVTFRTVLHCKSRMFENKTIVSCFEMDFVHGLKYYRYISCRASKNDQILDFSLKTRNNNSAGVAGSFYSFYILKVVYHCTVMFSLQGDISSENWSLCYFEPTHIYVFSFILPLLDTQVQNIQILLVALRTPHWFCNILSISICKTFQSGALLGQVSTFMSSRHLASHFQNKERVLLLCFISSRPLFQNRGPLSTGSL